MRRAVVDHSFTIPLFQPTFIDGVVLRINNVDELHLSGVVGQQRFKRDKVIALHNQIALARIAASKFGHILEQMKRHLQVMA